MREFNFRRKALIENRPALPGFEDRIPRLQSPRSRNGHSKGSPRVSLVLSWLQGIFHRARGLDFLLSLMFLTLGIFKGKDADPLGTKNPSRDPDVSTLPNQKWLVRRRDHTGKLRHLETLDHEPSDDELKEFGPGSYSILTTKPHLQGCKSVVIEDKGVSAPSRRVLKPVGTEKPVERFPSVVRQTDPTTLLTGRYAQVSDKEPKTRDITKTTPEPIVQPRSEPKKELADLIKELQKPITAEIAGQTEKASKETSFPIPKSEEPRPKEMCARCLEPSSSIITCDYCGQKLCRGFSSNCYEEHDCPKSKVCHKCGRRVPNEIVEIAELCHQYFCSPKCMNECRMGNIVKLGCAGCASGAINKREKEEVERKMEESDGCGEEPQEEEESDEEEEMCDGVPKRIACRRCQKENCQGRFCDGYCSKCRFDACEIRCEYGGECKFCTEFDDCEIRCIEAPDRCDRKQCAGFRCEDRWVSGADCDQDCSGCGEEGCYFFWHQDVEDSNDEE
jgi:hypothetical protein